MGPSSESIPRLEWCCGQADIRVRVLGGSRPSRCHGQAQSRDVRTEQRGRAKDGAAPRQLSESNLRGFLRG